MCKNPSGCGSGSGSSSKGNKVQNELDQHIVRINKLLTKFCLIIVSDPSKVIEVIGMRQI